MRAITYRLALMLLVTISCAAQGHCPKCGGTGHGWVWAQGSWRDLPCDKAERNVILKAQKAERKARWKDQKAALKEHRTPGQEFAHIARLTVMYSIIGVFLLPMILVEHPE